MASELRVRTNFIGGLVENNPLSAADTVVTDGATNTNTTVTSATAAFVANDVGLPISGGSIPAGATISSVTNATTVVISAAATTTATGVTLTIGRGTRLTSTALAAIPVIGTTQHFPITLDPDGLYGEPEIVYITAHTSAATTATILRAQEGTTARAHNRDVTWTHGPTVRDFPKIKFSQRTTGSFSTNNTAYADLDNTGGLDVVLDAAVSDLIEVGISGLWSNDAVDGYLDVFTLVAGSPVAGSAWGGTNGVPAWTGPSGIVAPISGSVMRLIVAGDLSTGTVTIRPRWRTGAVATKNLNASAATPIQVWAKNHGSGA